jgi:hypothetical protein
VRAVRGGSPVLVVRQTGAEPPAQGAPPPEAAASPASRPILRASAPLFHPPSASPRAGDRGAPAPSSRRHAFRAPASATSRPVRAAGAAPVGPLVMRAASPAGELPPGRERAPESAPAAAPAASPAARREGARGRGVVWRGSPASRAPVLAHADTGVIVSAGTRFGGEARAQRPPDRPRPSPKAKPKLRERKRVEVEAPVPPGVRARAWRAKTISPPPGKAAPAPAPPPPAPVAEQEILTVLRGMARRSPEAEDLIREVRRQLDELQDIWKSRRFP